MAFKAYIDQLDLPADQAGRARAEIADSEALCALLDDVQPSGLGLGLGLAVDRRAIVPPDMPIGWKHNIRKQLGGDGHERDNPPAGWERVVEYRQRVTLTLSFCSTGLILWLSSLTLRAQQMPETMMIAYLVVYGLMTFFLCSNFYKLMLGTWHMLRGVNGNPWHPVWRGCDPDPARRVAVIFPVYHEDAARVAAGMAATWESIRDHAPDLADRFDFFMLSDSRRIEYWLVEQAACHTLRETQPDARIFYRRRGSNSNAKLGTICSSGGVRGRPGNG